MTDLDQKLRALHWDWHGSMHECEGCTEWEVIRTAARLGALDAYERSADCAVRHIGFSNYDIAQRIRSLATAAKEGKL